MILTNMCKTRQVASSADLAQIATAYLTLWLPEPNRLHEIGANTGNVLSNDHHPLQFGALATLLTNPEKSRGVFLILVFSSTSCLRNQSKRPEPALPISGRHESFVEPILFAASRICFASPEESLCLLCPSSSMAL